MIALLRRFVLDDKGLEMVEYAVVAALIVVAGIIGLSDVKNKIATEWPKITNALP